MLFLINPGGKRPTHGKAAVVRRVKRRKKKAQLDTKRKRRKNSGASTLTSRSPVRARTTRSSVMATRRRRRRKAAAKSAAPRRRRRVARRRRRVAAFASNPPRRRRRRAVALTANPRRRRRRRHSVAHHRYRKNPPSMRSILSQVKLAAMDGAGIFVGQVATRKIRGAVTGMLPDSAKLQVASGAGLIALNLASAIAVTAISHRFAKGHARALAGGAMAEVINTAVNQTSFASYLGAFAVRRPTRLGRGVNRNVSAWPMNRGVTPGMGAWPSMRSVGMPSNAGV